MATKTLPADAGLKPDDLPACKNSSLHPDTWYPDLKDDKTGAAAKRVCVADCPVRITCGKGAIARGEKFGIFAGFNIEDERDELEKWLQIATAERIKCAGCGKQMSSARRGFCWPCIRGLKDARPAQEHLELLRVSGLGFRAIARAAGLNRETVRAIPNNKSISPVTEKALLSVPIPEHAYTDPLPKPTWPAKVQPGRRCVSCQVPVANRSDLSWTGAFIGAEGMCDRCYSSVRRARARGARRAKAKAS